MLAGGLHGIENELELEPAFAGNAYESTTPSADDAARGPRRCSPASEVAREVFGDEVVDHYTNNADVELAAFDAAVTDWERFRRLREDVTMHRKTRSSSTSRR